MSDTTTWQDGKARVSVCCAATIHAEDGGRDFFGPETYPIVRTCWFVCDGCGEACNTVAVE